MVIEMIRTFVRERKALFLKAEGMGQLQEVRCADISFFAPAVKAATPRHLLFAGVSDHSRQALFVLSSPPSAGLA